MKNDKYVMFRNIMYNELGITKEDIREWTKEAVIKTVGQYLESFNISDYIQRLIDYRIENELFKGNAYDRIIHYIADDLTDKLEIKVKNEI